MADPYDAPVAIGRPIRIVLGAAIILGATLLAFGGLIGDWSRASGFYQAVVVRIVLTLMGLGFGYVGVRLILVNDGAPLLTPKASFALGVLLLIFGLTFAIALIQKPSIGGTLGVLFFGGAGLRLCLRRRRRAPHEP